jgi:hypothetical protein
MTVLTEEQLEFYIDHPLEFIEDMFPEYNIDEQQIEIIKAIPKALKDGKSISVRAGHGV